ncbi:hypothetical protein HNQ44_003015 [Planomicrobium koreense]|uniref:PepSY domain-containing protein n=1 Tax=Planococcus koreensis TaxID=112331 RepID=A0A7W8CX25_9BACL|nr:hypothetical protein [Planococcus koreensis]MBB5181550.1 hypothetical protein [Planococcus koreensis]
MKKIVSGVLLTIVILLLYTYQKPIMTTEEAIVQAYNHLNDPSQGVGIEEIEIELGDIPANSINLKLHSKEGLLNEFFNMRQWVVTVKYQNLRPTVVMDAYTGKLLEISGPLN